MKLYITKEFKRDAGSNIIPIKGFKAKLVQYMDGFTPSIDQSTVFKGYSSLFDGAPYPTKEGLGVLIEATENPSRLDISGKIYYDGMIVYYYSIIEQQWKVAMLIDDVSEMVEGINAIKILNLNANIYLYSDKYSTSYEHVTMYTAIRENSKLASILSIMYDSMVTDGLCSELNILNSIKLWIN